MYKLLFSSGLLLFLQSFSSHHAERFFRLFLGSSPGLWAATAASYSPSRSGELPKNNPKNLSAWWDEKLCSEIRLIWRCAGLSHCLPSPCCKFTQPSLSFFFSFCIRILWLGSWDKPKIDLVSEKSENTEYLWALQVQAEATVSYYPRWSVPENAIVDHHWSIFSFNMQEYQHAAHHFHSLPDFVKNRFCPELSTSLAMFKAYRYQCC